MHGTCYRKWIGSGGTGCPNCRRTDNLLLHHADTRPGHSHGSNQRYGAHRPSSLTRVADEQCRHDSRIYRPNRLLQRQGMQDSDLYSVQRGGPVVTTADVEGHSIVLGTEPLPAGPAAHMPEEQFVAQHRQIQAQMAARWVLHGHETSAAQMQPGDHSSSDS